MAKPILIVGRRDFTNRIGSINVIKEITYKSVITTRDGIEKPSQQRLRTMIEFTLLPASPDVIAADLAELVGLNLLVQYTDPYTNNTATKVMRLDGQMEEVYALSSVNGKNYYIGKKIRLRQNGVG